MAAAGSRVSHPCWQRLRDIEIIDRGLDITHAAYDGKQADQYR